MRRCFRLHDDDNVYFYIDVEDSAVIDDSLSLREDDGVVVFIDGSVLPRALFRKARLSYYMMGTSGHVSITMAETT